MNLYKNRAEATDMGKWNKTMALLGPHTIKTPTTTPTSHYIPPIKMPGSSSKSAKKSGSGSSSKLQKKKQPPPPPPRCQCAYFERRKRFESQSIVVVLSSFFVAAEVMHAKEPMNVCYEDALKGRLLMMTS
ncbi:hypothetical protein S40293_11119 [Stachybotrys chartarum IBT 40293]|nr:hypothetical protein S40293_11119 [Stachybotrys chartarum IBT 40293]